MPKNLFNIDDAFLFESELNEEDRLIMEKSYTTEASMAKLFASELSVRIALEAVQIHGGYGWLSKNIMSNASREIPNS